MCTESVRGLDNCYNTCSQLQQHLVAFLTESWWEFSFETAIHVYNRTPLRQTNWSTPYENIFAKKPDVHYFKTFGCLAWVYTPKESCKNKLVPRSEQMTFIGYDMGAKETDTTGIYSE